MVIFRQLKGRSGVNDFDITEELSGDADGAHGDDFFGEIKKDIDAKVY